MEEKDDLLHFKIPLQFSFFYIYIYFKLPYCYVLSGFFNILSGIIMKYSIFDLSGYKLSLQVFHSDFTPGTN